MPQAAAKMSFQIVSKCVKDVIAKTTPTKNCCGCVCVTVSKKILRKNCDVRSTALCASAVKSGRLLQLSF